MQVDIFTLFAGFVFSILLIIKYFLPSILTQIKIKRKEMIESKLELQKNLKHVLSEYEVVNNNYLNALEKKVLWIEEAEKLFQKEKQILEKKHKKEMHDLNKEYDKFIAAAKIKNQEIYIDVLFSLVSKQIQTESKNIDHNKILKM